MPEITKTADASSSVPTFVWVLLAVLIVFVYLFGLNIPLLGPDEPRYAQVAREMFDRGDWVTPTLGGFNWFEKPALLYWLQITFYNIFGVSEFAARFGSALFGLGTVASLCILAKSVRRSQISDLKFESSSSGFANWLSAYRRILPRHPGLFTRGQFRHHPHISNDGVAGEFFYF